MRLKKMSQGLRSLRVVLGFLMTCPSAWATLTASSPDANSTIVRLTTTVSGTCDSSEVGAKNIVFKISGDISPPVNVTCASGAYSVSVNLKAKLVHNNIYVDESWKRPTSSVVPVYGNVPVYETVPVYKTVKGVQVQTGTKQVKTGTVYQQTGTKTVAGNTTITNPRQTLTITVDPTLLVWPDGAALSLNRTWADSTVQSPSASFPAVMSPTSGSDTRPVRYQYSIGSSAGATDILSWTLLPLNQMSTGNYLSGSMVSNTPYYTNVRAVSYTGSNYKTLSGKVSSTLSSSSWYFSNTKITGTLNLSNVQASSVSSLSSPISWDLHFSSPISASSASNLRNYIGKGGSAPVYGPNQIWSVTDAGDHQNFTLQTSMKIKMGTIFPQIAFGSVTDSQGQLVNSTINGTPVTYTVCNDNAFSGGSGTGEDPYQIATVSDLQNVHCNLNKNFILTSDIDLTGVDFPPIGGDAYGNFTGTFDGRDTQSNVHTISNWTYSSNGESTVGLFGALTNGGTVKYLNVSNFSVTNQNGSYISLFVGLMQASTVNNVSVSASTFTLMGSTYAGGLVGYESYSNSIPSSISNSSSSISITNQNGYSNWDVGSLAGYEYNSTINNCTAAGSISGSNFYYTGGLVGQAGGGTVNNSSSSVTLTAGGNTNTYIGGLIGITYWTGLANDSYSGDLTCNHTEGCGGLVGYANQHSTISNSRFTGNLSASVSNFVGGLVGYAFLYSSLDSSFSSGSITVSNGTVGVGGLVGIAFQLSPITKSFATGPITSSGSSQIGGLVGDLNWSTLSNSYYSGSIQTSGDSFVAGLVGFMNAGYGGNPTIQNSYSLGTSSTNIGGIYGGTNGSITVNHSFYNTSLISGGGNNAAGTGKGTDDMKTNANTNGIYSTWDSSIWNIVDGSYPTLK